MNLHKGDNVNRLHSKVINTIPYIFKHELLTIKTIKVMIVRKLEEVKNALLHDAILIAINTHLPFRLPFQPISFILSFLVYWFKSIGNT